MHVRIHVHIYIHVHVHMHMHIQIYEMPIHICRHAYIYTLKKKNNFRGSCPRNAVTNMPALSKRLSHLQIYK